MATLNVLNSTDFTGDVLEDIDDIVFGSAGSIIATFASNQFGSGLISNAVAIAGGAGTNVIKVNLASTGTFSAAGWTFSTWSGSDLVQIFGTAGNDTITGGLLADTLFGGAGADILNGGSGSDRASYDTASAGVRVDLIDPSTNTGDAAGDTYNSIESLTGSAFDDELIGNAGTNSLIGGAGRDELFGDGGNDKLYGQDGNDSLDGDDGDDTLSGGAGDDFLDGGIGNDSLAGGDGNDQLQGGDGVDILLGGSGSDLAAYSTAVFGGVIANLSDASVNTGDAEGDIYDSIENLAGTNFADILTGTIGTNSLFGGEGADLILGLGGNDKLYGGERDDTLNGGAGADYLSGGAGLDSASYETATAGIIVNLANPGGNIGDAVGDTYNSIENLIGSAFDDILTGNAAKNKISGGDGHDLLIGGAGGDLLYGGNGSDRVSYADSTAGVIAKMTGSNENTGDAAGDGYDSIESLTGSAFNDTLTGWSVANSLIGGAGDDTILGLDGNDKLYGQDGNDTLVGGKGADALSGGAGVDTASYSSATGSGIVVNLSDPTQNTGDARGDTYNSVENVIGSGVDGHDTLTGNAAANNLRGLGGWDVLNGLGGNDILEGGGGNDTLTGGAGADAFLLSWSIIFQLPNLDTITDFNVADDTIWLDDHEYDTLGLGALPASAFVANVTGLATDPAHRIIYETDTGILRYDENGSVGAPGKEIAHLTAGLVLTAADFLVV